MSIKAEIDRLAEAKGGIIDALSAKGATLSGEERLDDLPSVISSMPSRAPDVVQATPTITVSSAGKITASATQSAGTVAAGTKSATKQLSVQAAKTVTPTTSNQTAVASGRYTTGAVTVKGDANLKAENIAKGVSIFGVTGTHQGGSSVGNVQVTVTVTTTDNNEISTIYYTTVSEDGTLNAVTETGIGAKSLTRPIASGTCFAFFVSDNTMMQMTTDGTEMMGDGVYFGYNGTGMCFLVRVTAAGENASFTI
ncbi:MAG: hypothetical protein E7654_05380 [Ruminococcaceae bacterium]|nr:hypothetical protein [Oscillospiraceae bacterium]